MLRLATILVLVTMVLFGCGMSSEERQKIAAVSCSIMSETRNMDAAIRVREINAAREKLGEPPYLHGDRGITESFEYGLCSSLVLNDPAYYPTLEKLQKIEAEERRQRLEIQRIAAAEREEKERLAREKREKKERLAREKREREEQIAAATPTVKEEFYPNGQLKMRAHYQSKNDGGKKHGSYKSWFENGKPWTEGTYKNGEWDGVKKGWWRNGQLQIESNYKNGQLDGLMRYWHEDGQLGSERSYKDGKLHGLSRSWTEDGVLEVEYTYENGKIISY